MIEGRCPHCGDRVEASAVTAEDHTPYAMALADGRRGWWTMCRWVYGAGGQRLAHLGLSQPSPWSRRFARLNTLLLTAAVTASALANAGWHPVIRRPGIDATAGSSPQGKGWVLAVARPNPLPTPMSSEIPVGLWWNPALAAVGGVVALAAALVACTSSLWIIETRSQNALVGNHRGTDRLRCAIQYSTAAMPLLALAAAALIPRPVTWWGQTADWKTIPSPAWFSAPAILITLTTLLLWWFWLIRVGGTVPKEARRAVQLFFILQAPLWVIGLVAGCGTGGYFLLRWLAQTLDLAW